MKLEAIERTVGRPKNVGQVVPDYFGKRSTEVVAEGTGESYKQVQRFIRLTNLIPELLDMVDEKKIAFNPAVELSYLDEAQQRDFLEAMEDTQNTPSLSQAQRLKKLAQEGTSRMTLLLPSWEKRKRTSWTRWLSKMTLCGNTFPAATPRNRWRTPSSSCWNNGSANNSDRTNADFTVTKDPMGSFSFATKRRNAYEKQRYPYHPLREDYH